MASILNRGSSDQAGVANGYVMSDHSGALPKQIKNTGSIVCIFTIVDDNSLKIRSQRRGKEGIGREAKERERGDRVGGKDGWKERKRNEK